MATKRHNKTQKEEEIRGPSKQAWSLEVSPGLLLFFPLLCLFVPFCGHSLEIRPAAGRLPGESA
jgi:hypothetical protein